MRQIYDINLSNLEKNFHCKWHKFKTLIQYHGKVKLYQLFFNFIIRKQLLCIFNSHFEGLIKNQAFIQYL